MTDAEQPEGQPNRPTTAGLLRLRRLPLLGWLWPVPLGLALGAIALAPLVRSLGEPEGQSIGASVGGFFGLVVAVAVRAAQRHREWSLHEWVSRLLAGAATGSMVLLAVDLLVLVPVWGPRLLKGDERWQTVFFVAKFWLPAGLALGALASVAWRRSGEVRLSRGVLVGCCLAIALVSQMLRPVVSRIHRGGIGPLYEVVPDTVVIVFCLVAVTVAVWHPGPRSPGKLPPPLPESPPLTPAVEEAARARFQSSTPKSESVRLAPNDVTEER